MLSVFLCSILNIKSKIKHFVVFFFSSTTLLLPTHLPPPLCTHAQSCNPMDCSLPGSSVHGLFQARILEWVAISFSKIKHFEEQAILNIYRRMSTLLWEDDGISFQHSNHCPLHCPHMVGNKVHHPTSVVFYYSSLEGPTV